MAMKLFNLADYVISNGRVDGNPDDQGGEFASSLIEEMISEKYFDEYDQWSGLSATRAEIEDWVYARY